MPNMTKNKIAKFKEHRNHKKKIYAWFTALALVVAGGTVWALVQPANTMSGEIICGMEEHAHTADCYERQLVCGQEESETHTHTEECWMDVAVCAKPEHAHIAECYDVTDHAESSESESLAENGSVSVLPDQSSSGAYTSEEQMEQAEQGVEPTKPVEVPVQVEEPQMPAEQTVLMEQMRKNVPADYTEVRTAQLPEGGAVYLFAQPGVIPEQVELKVQLVDEASEVFAQAKQRVQDAGVSYDYLKALDISLVDETGAEIEPTAPVYVSMDTGALLPEEANPETIRIQHHKEIMPSEQDETMQDEAVPTAEGPEVVVESVMDDTKGTLTQIENTSTCVATFPVDSFSIYTITSKGWANLKIRVQCVDEYGNELLAEHAPADVVLNEAHHSGAAFDINFMTNEHPEIENYEYAGHAYFMRGGEYESRIYGLRRENGTWYYRPNDNKDSKSEFKIQPNFEGENPPDFIRLVYKKKTEIPVQYMDDSGGWSRQEVPLSPSDAPHGKNPEILTYTGTVLDISDTANMPKSQTYFYVGRAYVGAPKRENEVVKVIRENNLPYGVTQEGKKLLISTESPLKVMYHEIQAGIPGVMNNTVSTKEKGLTINLFDYNSGDSAWNSEMINEGKNLHFGPFNPNYQGHVEPYNRWTGRDGGIYTGIVGNTLVNGYPTVDGKFGQQSLDYLFSPEIGKQELEQETDPAKRNIKHMHTNLDHLFWQDKDGYYRFDAMTNFATIMAENSEEGHRPDHIDGGNFIVYQQPALPGEDGAKFMPFDKYSEVNKHVPENSKDDTRDFHFGMTMEAEFVMPPGGRIPDASGAHTGLRDMIFEFNGDDDVWVFIDGKLALDLGGIHGRYGGSINFRTGEVTTNAPPAPHSGWKQDNLYGIKGDPNSMTDDQLKAAREAAGFGKYSQHHFKFFYLERGKNASNCEIKFNLLPVEHGLVIGKRIPAEMDGAATEHMWYQFQVEAEHNGQPHPLANATYRRIEWKPESHPITGGHTIDVGQTDENGRFWLRAGERADFVGAVDLKHAGAGEHDNIKIYVSEIFPDRPDVPVVTAWSGKEEEPGTYMVVTDAKGKTRSVVPPLYDSTGWKDLSETWEGYPDVKFHTNGERPRQIKENGEILNQVEVTTGRDNEFNWIDFENDIGALSGLNITKHARHTESDTPIPDVPFAIRVELWDTKDQKWIPLPVGAEYWILNPEEAPAEKPKLHLEEADQGLISITDGQTIHLHVLPGTRYRVSEALTLEEAAVYTTTYGGRTGVDGEELEKFTDEAGKQSGIGNKSGIAAGDQHYVTITNKGDPILMPDGSFVLTKQAMGVVPTEAKFKFNLQIQGAVDGNPPEYPCTATYYGYPDGAHSCASRHGCEEPIVFKPNTSGDGTGGGNYEANLYLYPGEIVVIEGLPDGKSLRVEEVFEENQTGHYEVSFHEEGKDSVVGKFIETTPIGSDHVVKVSCVNQSNLQENSVLKLSKKVKRTDQPNGNPLPEDMKKPFTFRLTLQKPAVFSPDQISAKVMSADGLITYFSLKFEPDGENYVAERQLLHGDTMTIEGLPISAQLVVEELNHDGYVASMNDVPGDRITVDLRYNTGAAYEVKCVNMTGVELPETGGHGIKPYVLAGTAMMLSAAGLLWLRRRHGKSGNA